MKSNIAKFLLVICLIMPQLNLEWYGSQYDFVTSPVQFTLLRGGIGSGKSMAGAGRAIAAAFGHVGNRQIKSPNVGVVTAPTYGILRDATLRTFLDVAGDFVSHHTKSPPINVTLINGSEIFFRSADEPDNLRGATVSWWWGDEAAYYHKNVWRIMIGRLRQFGVQGLAWLTTTPKGRNWVWQEFDQHRRPNYAMFNARTGENPFIDIEFFRTLQDAYGGNFALQELDGEFIAFEGLIYAAFDRDKHTFSKFPEFAHTVAGVDWGYVHPGVILVFGVDYDGRLWLIHEEYRRKLNIDDWAPVAKQVKDTYGIKTFYCDPSEPTYIKKFKDVGCKAVPANNEVQPGIQRVESRLIRQKDRLPRLMIHTSAVHTLTEFEQYQWAEGRDGLREEPLKTNDHTMDAMRYVVNALDGEQRKPMKAEARAY